MKRLKYVLVITSMIVMLTGCGNTAPSVDETGKKPDQEQSQEVNGEEITTTESATQADSVNTNISVEIRNESDEKYSEDDVLLITSYYEYPVVTMEDTAVSDKIAAYYDKDKETMDQAVEEYIGYAKEDYDYRMTLEDPFWAEYSVDTYTTKQRVDDRIISFQGDSYEFTGGAHGNPARYGVNFDARTGEKLTLSDVVKSEADFRTFEEQFIADQCKNLEFSQDLFEGYEDSIKDILDDNTWLLTDRGLMIICNPYLLGPYAMGTLDFTIPYEELGDYLKEDYMKTTTAAVFPIDFDEKVEADVDNDGTIDIVQIKTMYSDDYSDITITVCVNDKAVDIEEAFGNTGSAYFIRKEDGSCGVMFNADYSSDDYNTYIYRLDSGTPEQTANVFADFDKASITPVDLKMCFKVDILGTWTGKLNYCIDDKWTLSTTDTEYVLMNGVDYAYSRSIVPTTNIASYSEDGLTQNADIAPGTAIYPVKTDGENFMIYETEDGSRGRINFTRKDGVIYIDGVSEAELFEELPYAG